MQTTVTERGQISIPAVLREKYHLVAGTGVEWMESAEGIFLLPVPKDPIAAFRGQSKGMNRVLLKDRQEDRKKEK